MRLVARSLFGEAVKHIGGQESCHAIW